MSRDGGQKKRKGESTELKRGQRKRKGLGSLFGLRARSLCESLCGHNQIAPVRMLFLQKGPPPPFSFKRTIHPSEFLMGWRGRRAEKKPLLLLLLVPFR